MRGKFNTTVDVFRGPGTPSPGALVGTYPCKLVREDAIETAGLGAPVVPYYLTIDAYEPVGSWTYAAFGLDPSLADQLAVPSGVSPQFWVLYTDVILWHALTPYWRAYLCRLPLPGAGSAGGVLVSGSALRIVARHFIGRGGVEIGSAASWRVVRHFIGLGGVELDSAAVVIRKFKLTSQGGCKVNSLASWFVTHWFYPGGGAKLNSSSIAAFIPGSGGPGNPLPVFDVFGVGGVGGVIRADMASIGGMVTGSKVQISGATVMTAANGLFLVTVISSFQIELDGSVANAVSDGSPTSTIECLVLI